MGTALNQETAMKTTRVAAVSMNGWLGDPERVRELLAQAGFAEIDVQAVDIEQRHPSFEVFWETTLDISRGFHDAVLSRPEPEIAEIRAGLASRLAPYTSAEGALAIPARTLVASATA